MFENGQRVRTIRVVDDFVTPLWRVGDEGVIETVVHYDEYARVRFDNGVADIVNFDEMEVVDE